MAGLARGVFETIYPAAGWRRPAAEDIEACTGYRRRAGIDGQPAIARRMRKIFIPKRIQEAQERLAPTEHRRRIMAASQFEGCYELREDQLYKWAL